MSTNPPRIALQRIETDVATLESTHPAVRSYGVMFALLRDHATDEPVGAGFEVSGRHRTFFRSRDALGHLLEAGGERAGLYHTDDLLDRCLRLTDDARAAFWRGWHETLDHLTLASIDTDAPQVIRFREALLVMRPEDRGCLEAYAEDAPAKAVGEVSP